MRHTKDPHGVLVKRKQYAVVADAEAKGAGHVTMQRRDVAAATAGILQDAVKQAQGRGAVQTADVVLGLIQPSMR